MTKRLFMSLLAVAAITLMVSGASFALFTASTGNTDNTFTAGTVALGTPSTTLVDITNIAPGDSGSATYDVEYTGSLDAWVGLDASLSGDLTTCDGGGQFSVTITDSAGNAYDANTANQVLGQLSDGDTVNLNIDWGLDLGAGNDCQGDSATLSLTVHAVQARNNTTPTGDGPISWN